MHGSLSRIRPMVGAALAFLLASAAGATAEPGGPPWMLEVNDVVARVGEPAQLTVRVRLREGFRFLDTYRNRAFEFSTQDDSVRFERRSVVGRIEGDTLVIDIPLTPKTPGPHVINGLVRIGYAEGQQSMYMVSLPLIATITGKGS